MATPSRTSGASDEVTVVDLTFFHCRCDRPVLDRLIAALRDRGALRSMRLEGTWYGTRFRRNDLEAIREAISGSAYPGDTRRLNQLHMEARGGDRLVVVTLGDETATVRVESGDSAWPGGKAAQIRSILEHAGGRLKRRRCRPWMWAIASAIGGAALLAVLWVLGAVPTSAVGIALVGVALVASAAAAGLLVTRRLVERRRPVIWIDGPLPRRGWRHWSVGDRIAALALIVAVLTLIGGWLGT
jgi:hypothetical protein